MAEQARGKNARIVEDEAVARAEVGRQIAKDAVFPTPLVAVDDQHAGSGAIGQRLLGDQVIGKVVIELGKIHPQNTWKQKTWFDPSGLSEYSPGSRLSPTSMRYSPLSRRLTSMRIGVGLFLRADGDFAMAAFDRELVEAELFGLDLVGFEDEDRRGQGRFRAWKRLPRRCT